MVFRENCIMRSFIICTLHQTLLGVIKPLRMGHVACMKEIRNAYTILFEKPEEKRSLGRPRCRWKNNIKLCHK
jgi:hypothetical protein